MVVDRGGGGGREGGLTSGSASSPPLPVMLSRVGGRSGTSPSPSFWTSLQGECRWRCGDHSGCDSCASWSVRAVFVRFAC